MSNGFIVCTYLRKIGGSINRKEKSVGIGKKIVAVKAMIKNFSDLQQFVAEKYEIQKWYYKFCNEQRQVVSWCSSVWDRLTMPKHRIILWLVLLDRLRTRDRLWKLHIVPTRDCLLCHGIEETASHLFFGCQFSSACLEYIKEWIQWKSKKINLEELLKWINKSKRSSRFRKDVQRAIVAACVYQIWRARNEKLWIQKIENVEQTVKCIKQGSINRIRQIIPKKSITGG